MKKSKISQARLWKEKGLVSGELEPSLGSRPVFPAASHDLRDSLLPRIVCIQMGMRDQYKLVGWKPGNANLGHKHFTHYLKEITDCFMQRKWRHFKYSLIIKTQTPDTNMYFHQAERHSPDICWSLSELMIFYLLKIGAATVVVRVTTESGGGMGVTLHPQERQCDVPSSVTYSHRKFLQILCSQKYDDRKTNTN